MDIIELSGLEPATNKESIEASDTLYLEGLGLIAGRKLTAAEAADALRLRNNSIRRQLKTETMPAWQKKIAAEANKLPAHVQKNIKEGKYEFQLRHFFKRAEITLGNGEIALWDAKNEELNGLSNLDGNSLPEGYYGFILGMAIGYSTHASSISAEDHLQEYFGPADIALDNAEVQLRFSGRTTSYPVKMIRATNGGDIVRVGWEGQSYQLPQKVEWKSGEKLDIYFKAHQPCDATKKHHCEVMLTVGCWVPK